MVISGGKILGYLVTEFVHHMIKDYIKEGDICIDATAGNGNDTVFLCSLVKEKGKVIALDIQEKAIQQTSLLLQEKGFSDIGKVILDSHVHINSYAKEDTIACIIFNLGYLPGGDHKIATNPESTLIAIERGLKLLKKDGILSVLIYSGKDSGFAERDIVLSYLEKLDSKKYLVIVSQYYNRINQPPIPVQIIKLK